MQDVTDLTFMRLLGQYGVPDYFFTEYFRVHGHSTLDQPIVDSILHHDTGRPVFAQMIGEDTFHLKRTAQALQDLPIAGVDLNMGCPAPKIYRKNVGGGLLRDPDSVESIFATLRETCKGRFTVKMRIGFEDDRHYKAILDLVNEYGVDALSIHGRTVKQMYRGDVDYERIQLAVEHVNCPVFANGNIFSAKKAKRVQESTGCHGVMIGRSAIRNPWIFRQIREDGTKPTFTPLLRDVRAYIDDLWKAAERPGLPDRNRLNRMKKFLNFVGQGVDPDGRFLHEMRRGREVKDFFDICDRHLLIDGRGEQPFAAEPYEGVHARPNHEDESCRL
ncbi:tRNA-dihydrouridine synthase family protein [Puniceicoccales bacterium CK1056]|uniref:tRNA-dihydrouridine synthase n=2 Tax=Oceanipulchritudo coccoides TaxID=2706888 RepID=A0A6B2M4C1_9BACT|nr:tRNA-dihydrouridine synthase family protein [Oceanipulchritudo coccoides]